MSSRASNPNPNPQSGHSGGGQSNPQSGHSGGGQPSSSGGPPTNEQLTQYLMIAHGLNREDATQELNGDPDTIKEEYQKVKQLLCNQQSS